MYISKVVLVISYMCIVVNINAYADVGMNLQRKILALIEVLKESLFKKFIIPGIELETTAI